MNAKIIISLFALAGLTGCASIVGGGDVQQVKINSNPTEADIVIERVTNKNDETKTIEYSLVTEGKTPVITSFSRCGAYRVTVEKDGVKKQELITHSFNPMMLGNIIFGGVIGLVVDAGTGANCKHKEEYTIDLTSNKTSPEAAKEENKIIKPKE